MLATQSDPRATSSAVEDYAKTIYALAEDCDGAISTTAVAERLGVTPGSASAMIKRLGELDLVSHLPYKGVELTEQGTRVALEVIRHHRLLELYLVRELGMGWDRVHAEAERLEHVISEELEALIAAKLGEPDTDPHGDPIPSPALELPQDATEPLDALEAGTTGCFVRVSDSDPAMLRYLTERGVAPGDAFEVIERQPFGGPLFVRFGEHVHAFGGALAASMRVIR